MQTDYVYIHAFLLFLHHSPIRKSMIQDYKSAVKNIRKTLSDYLDKYKLQSLVLGISGGIDSALTAALVRPVCDAHNIQLIGRSITIETNKENEITRAKHVGEAYCHNFKEIDLTEAYQYIQPLIAEDALTADKHTVAFKLRMGNLKARMRMQALYDLAAAHKGMVLSTDNYTEYLLGFWTLHGDVGDWGPIQNIWKTEVYEMADFLTKTNTDIRQARALSMCMEAIPTDGLGITDTDLEQIQAATYQEADKILIHALSHPEDDTYKDHPVVQRHYSSAFKRNNPYNIPRKSISNEDYF